MRNNSPVNFIMFNTELLEWVGEKDRRHYTSEKMKKGIMSYTQALHDIGFFFKKVCTNEVRPNSQPLSAWARSWGWDFRKTVRFVNIVLRYLFDLNHALKKAKDLKERIENAYDRQKQKATNYMRKIRNSAISSAQDIVNDDETADERLFLDAMAALAKTNPIYYRAKIKEKLRSRDKSTIENYQNWLANNLKHKNQTINTNEVEEVLKTKLIVGHKVIQYVKKSNNSYRLIFDNYFETDMTIDQIIKNAE